MIINKQLKNANAGGLKSPSKYLVVDKDGYVLEKFRSKICAQRWIKENEILDDELEIEEDY